MNTRPLPYPSPAPLRHWSVGPEVYRHVERELQAGRTLSSIVEDPEVRDANVDPYLLIGALASKQSLDEIEDPLADLSVGHVRRFSLLGRHNAGRELAGYLIGQLSSGRSLPDILGDDWVRDRVGKRAYLLEDLASDQLVKQAAQPTRASPRPTK